MLRLSKRVEYALMALLHMDEQGDQVVSVAELAALYQIPVEMLGKVMQSLARSGVVTSVHGAHGGYKLGKAVDDLVLGDVLEAVEGPFRLVRCQETPQSCDQYGVCNIREPVLAMQDQLLNYLAGFKLKTFRRSPQNQIKREKAV